MKARRVATVVVALMMAFMLLAPSASAKKSLTPEEIRARQTKIGTEMAKVWQNTKDEKEVEKYLQKQGLEIVARPEPSEFSIMSNSADVNLPGPSVAYDRSINQYYMWFNFSWKSTAALNADAPWCQRPFTCNIGGSDLWAIHVNDDSVLTLAYQQFLVSGNITGSGSSYNPVFNSGNNGAAIEYQDKIDTNYWPTNNFNTYGGSMTVWMNPTGVHKSGVQIRSRMAHTWSSVSITGGSFSNTGLSINFSTGAERWDAQGSTITYYNF